MPEGDEDDSFEELLESLENIVEHLDRTVIDVMKDLKASGAEDPYLMRDANGRYIMLDAVTALATAKAALLNATL